LNDVSELLPIHFLLSMLDDLYRLLGMWFLSPSFVTLFFLTVLTTFAQSSDFDSNKAAQILQELDQLETKQKEILRSSRMKDITILQGALHNSSSATRLYENAVEKLQFQGLKGEAQAFDDWKKKNANLLGSKEMESALRLHLRYLVLSLERGGAEKGEDFANPSLAYAVELESALLDQAKPGNLPPEVKSLLERSLAESIFTKSMDLSNWLPKDKDWEMKPGDFNGILEKNVRPFFRALKNPLLVQTWDMQMKFQAQRITRGRLDHEADSYNSITLPKVVFSRANDMLILGQNDQGCTEILQLIRTHPAHQDFPQWVSRVREILNSKKES